MSLKYEKLAPILIKGHSSLNEKWVQDRIAEDPQTPHHRAMAAAMLLCAREPGWDKLNRYPKALMALREILDRTVGKPTIQIEADIHHHDVPRGFDDFVQRLRMNPGHCERLAQMLKLAEMPADELPAYLNIAGNPNYDPNYFDAADDGSSAVEKTSVEE